MIKYSGKFQLIIDDNIYAEILRDIRFTDIKVNNAVRKLIKQLGVPEGLINIILNQLVDTEYTFDDNDRKLIFDIDV